MSAEPLPTPGGSAARSRRAEGLTRSAFARPVLALVPNPVRARRAPFVALILGVLLVGLLSLLLLNTTTAQDAFTLHRLQASAANAADERQALSEQVNQLTGPSGLAAQAAAMGMVPAGAPVFWNPGDPLPPGARVLDGMVVMPAAAVPGPSATPSAAAPAAATPPPGSTAVTAVPRPGQSAAAKTSTSTSTRATAPKPSTSASARPTAKAGSTAKPASKAATKPTATPAAGGSTR